MNHEPVRERGQRRAEHWGLVSRRSRRTRKPEHQRPQHQHAPRHHGAPDCGSAPQGRGQHLAPPHRRLAREHAVLRQRTVEHGTSSGRASTTITPSTAVNAIEDAMSAGFAPMIGATAAMAELPQIELPHATSTDIFRGSPSARHSA